MVNFADKYRRYCGDSNLRYYDLSPILLLETPGFYGASVDSAPWTPSKTLPWDLNYSAPSDPQLARAMTFACRAHGMTSSLTQQTFGGGGGGEGEGDHMKFLKTEGDQQFFCFFQGGINKLIESFIPFLPPPPPPPP